MNGNFLIVNAIEPINSRKPFLSRLPSWLQTIVKLISALMSVIMVLVLMSLIPFLVYSDYKDYKWKRNNFETFKAFVDSLSVTAEKKKEYLKYPFTIPSETRDQFSGEPPPEVIRDVKPNLKSMIPLALLSVLVGVIVLLFTISLAHELVLSIFF